MEEASIKTEVKKEKRKNKWISVSVTLFIAIILLSVLIVLGYVFKPKIQSFVEKFKGDTIIQNGKKEIISEENVVIDVVKKASPSVVSIALSQIEFQPGQGVVDSNNNIGTGFVVDKSGIIVTNQHVVSDLSATYKVVTSDGKDYEVKDILVDSNNDIAIVKVDAQNLTPLALGDSDKLQVGQMVIAIGTPLGEYAGSVTTGIISGLNRSVTTQSSFLGTTSKEYNDVIQTDAAINPGNSGGPLIDSSSEVIGINFATTSGADNISFALPVNVVKKRLDEYRKYGKFIKPYIGVEYQMISEDAARYYKNVVAGALIVRVVPNSPAQKAGIKQGDIVTEINDKKMNKSLATVVQEYKVGEELTLKVWKNGKTSTLKLTLAEAE